MDCIVYGVADLDMTERLSFSPFSQHTFQKAFLKCLANPKEGKNRENKEKSNSKMIDSKPVIAIITLKVQ